MALRGAMDRLRDRVAGDRTHGGEDDAYDDVELHPVRSRFLKAWLGILHADDSHPLLVPKRSLRCDVVVYLW